MLNFCFIYKPYLRVARKLHPAVKREMICRLLKSYKQPLNIYGAYLYKTNSSFYNTRRISSSSSENSIKDQFYTFSRVTIFMLPFSLSLVCGTFPPASATGRPASLQRSPSAWPKRNGAAPRQCREI